MGVNGGAPIGVNGGVPMNGNETPGAQGSMMTSSDCVKVSMGLGPESWGLEFEASAIATDHKAHCCVGRGAPCAFPARVTGKQRECHGAQGLSAP
jgi:hypothetical protein